MGERGPRKKREEDRRREKTFLPPKKAPNKTRTEGGGKKKEELPFPPSSVRGKGVGRNFFINCLSIPPSASFASPTTQGLGAPSLPLPNPFQRPPPSSRQIPPLTLHHHVQKKRGGRRRRSKEERRLLLRPSRLNPRRLSPAPPTEKERSTLVHPKTERGWREIRTLGTLFVKQTFFLGMQLTSPQKSSGFFQRVNENGAPSLLTICA